MKFSVKSFSILVAATALLFSCKSTSITPEVDSKSATTTTQKGGDGSAVVSAGLVSIDGSWIWKKANPATATTVNEEYNFDINNRKFVVYVDSKVKESGTFEFDSANDKAALKFSTDNTIAELSYDYENHLLILGNRVAGGAKSSTYSYYAKKN